MIEHDSPAEGLEGRPLPSTNPTECLQRRVHALAQTCANAIEICCRRQQWTRRQLAHHSGVSESWLYDTLAARARPDFGKIVQIAAALNLHVCVLFSHESNDHRLAPQSMLVLKQQQWRRLRDAMRAEHLSVHELKARSGLSQATVYRLVRGSAAPSLLILAGLEQAFDRPAPTWLLP